MGTDIRQLSSRIVYENPWMTVREDEIERADGSKGIYGVIEKPDFALIIPVERGGFHLVQEYRYAIGRRVWSFPQGTFPNRQDGDPTELARAELLEETGIRADRLVHLGFMYTSQGSSGQGFNAFVALDLHHGDPRREHEEQDMIHAWFLTSRIHGTRRIKRDARRCIPCRLRTSRNLGRQAARQSLTLRNGRLSDQGSGPRPVVAAVVISHHGVLVAKRNDGKPPWTFITGEIEPGESPSNAAVREVEEETGLRIRAGDMIGSRVHPQTGRTIVYVAARPTGGTEAFVGDADELAEVRWVSFAEADELMRGQIFEPVRQPR